MAAGLIPRLKIYANLIVEAFCEQLIPDPAHAACGCPAAMRFYVLCSYELPAW